MVITVMLINKTHHVIQEFVLHREFVLMHPQWAKSLNKQSERVRFC